MFQIFIWTFYITSIAQCIQFIENTGENFNADFNTTTLYPVDKIPFIKATTEFSNILKISEKDVKTDKTTWKINTSFVNLEHEDEITHLPIKTNELNDKNCNESYKIKQINKESKTTLTLPKEHNNVEDYSDPENEKEVTKKHEDNEEDKSLKEFKPSPHLNSYYDTIEDSPTFTTSTSTPDTSKFIG